MTNSQSIEQLWGMHVQKMKSYGFDIRNTSELQNHRLTYGIEYRKDEVSSEYLASDSVWQDWAYDADVGIFKELGNDGDWSYTGHYISSRKIILLVED